MRSRLASMCSKEEWKVRRTRAHEWAKFALQELAVTPKRVQQLPDLDDPTLIFRGGLVHTTKSSLHSNDDPRCRCLVLEELQVFVVSDVAELVWQYAVGYWVNVRGPEEQSQQQSLTQVEYLRLLAYATTHVAYSLMMISHGVARGVAEAAASSECGTSYFGHWAAVVERVREDYGGRHRYEVAWNERMTRSETHDSVEQHMADDELGLKISHYTGATALVVTPKALIQQDIEMISGLKTYQQIQFAAEPDVVVLYHLDSSSAYGYVRKDTGFAVHIYP